MPVASSYAGSENEQLSMKKSMQANNLMHQLKHKDQKTIPNPYFFKIDDTTLPMKRGTVTISGHGAYNPDENTIFGWGTYSINIGSRVVTENWQAANLVSGNGNPYGDDSDESKVHFIGTTPNKKAGKETGNNAKRESVQRGGHQLWIFADAAQGKMCVYGSYVGMPTPKSACIQTNTISITK